MSNYSPASNVKSATALPMSRFVELLCEALVPVLVLASVLPHWNISYKSTTAILIALTYAMIASVFKVVVTDKVKAWAVAEKKSVEFHVGAALVYSFIALGTLYLFTLFSLP